MITPFERFCVTHACARWCIGQNNFCPLAAFLMLKNDSIDGRTCKLLWNEIMQNEEVICNEVS